MKHSKLGIHIQNSVKYLKWSFLQKRTVNCFSTKTLMFDNILNMPLDCFLFCHNAASRVFQMWQKCKKETWCHEFQLILDCFWRFIILSIWLISGRSLILVSYLVSELWVFFAKTPVWVKQLTQILYDYCQLMSTTPPPPFPPPPKYEGLSFYCFVLLKTNFQGDTLPNLNLSLHLV